MSDDPIPDPIAALDQAMAEMGTFAKVIRAHFTALVEAGFTDEQAFALALSLQASLAAKF